jgi:hypothetical protein
MAGIGEHSREIRAGVRTAAEWPWIALKAGGASSPKSKILCMSF